MRSLRAPALSSSLGACGFCCVVLSRALSYSCASSSRYVLSSSPSSSPAPAAFPVPSLCPSFVPSPFRYPPPSLLPSFLPSFFPSLGISVLGSFPPRVSSSVALSLVYFHLLRPPISHTTASSRYVVSCAYRVVVVKIKSYTIYKGEGRRAQAK